MPKRYLGHEAWHHDDHGAAGIVPALNLETFDVGSRPPRSDAGSARRIPVPGYTGYVPGVEVENVHGKSFLHAHKNGKNSGAGSVCSAMSLKSGDFGDKKGRSGAPLTFVAGYTGHVRGKRSENLHGKYVGWDESKRVMTARATVGSRNGSESGDSDQHWLVRKDWQENLPNHNPTNGASVPELLIPGYTGHVPGSMENVHGMTHDRARRIQTAEVGMHSGRSTPVSTPRGSDASANFRPRNTNERAGSEIPGYTGYIGGKRPEIAVMGANNRSLHDQLAVQSGRNPTRPELPPGEGEQVAFKDSRTLNWPPPLMGAQVGGPRAHVRASVAIPGYSGHVAGTAENIHGKSYTETHRHMTGAVGLRSPAASEVGSPMATPRHNPDGSLPRRLGTDIPGYEGYVPGKHSENNIGSTYRAANDVAAISTGRDPILGPMGARPIPDTLRETEDHLLESATHREIYGHEPKPCVAIPGYKGHIPGKKGDNSYGKTFRVENTDLTIGTGHDNHLGEHVRYGREHTPRVEGSPAHNTAVASHVSGKTPGQNQDNARVMPGQEMRRLSPSGSVASYASSDSGISKTPSSARGNGPRGGPQFAQRARPGDVTPPRKRAGSTSSIASRSSGGLSAEQLNKLNRSFSSGQSVVSSSRLSSSAPNAFRNTRPASVSSRASSGAAGGVLRKYAA